MASTSLTPAGRDLGDLRCCNKCQQWLPRDIKHYFRDKDGVDGWSRTCKPCDRAYQTRRRELIRIGERLPKRRPTTSRTNG